MKSDVYRVHLTAVAEGDAWPVILKDRGIEIGQGIIDHLVAIFHVIYIVIVICAEGIEVVTEFKKPSLLQGLCIGDLPIQAKIIG